MLACCRQCAICRLTSDCNFWCVAGCVKSLEDLNFTQQVHVNQDSVLARTLALGHAIFKHATPAQVSLLTQLPRHLFSLRRFCLCGEGGGGCVGCGLLRRFCWGGGGVTPFPGPYCSESRSCIAAATTAPLGVAGGQGAGAERAAAALPGLAVRALHPHVPDGQADCTRCERDSSMCTPLSSICHLFVLYASLFFP